MINDKFKNLFICFTCGIKENNIMVPMYQKKQIMIKKSPFFNMIGKHDQQISAQSRNLIKLD